MDFKWPGIVKTREVYLLFYAFTKSEFSNETLEFLIAVAKAKSSADYDKIHEIFIVENAPSQINLPGEIEKGLSTAYSADKEPDYAAYKEALKPAVRDVVHLLSQDTWSRFKRSDLYTNYWMDEETGDDKLLKLMKAVNIDEIYEGGKKWKAMSRPLKKINKALKEEDLYDFIEEWEGIENIAKVYIRSHKLAVMPARRKRVKLLEEMTKYYKHVVKEFKSKGVDLT